MGVKVKGQSVKAVVGRDRWVRVPRLEVVECELDVGDKAIPQVKRKGDMNRGKGGNNVILRRPNIPLGKIRTMIVGGHKLNGHIYRGVGKI